MKWGTGTANSIASRIKWWDTRASYRGLPPWPLTLQKINLAAALLYKGGYRSGPLYLSAARKQHIQLGYAITQQMEQELGDAGRALRRGLGPAKQAEPLYMEKLVEFASALPPGLGRRVAHGAIIGSWWMMREIEVASLLQEQVTYQRCEPRAQRGFATVCLPMSKADWRHLHKKRSHQCVCPDPCCPVKAMGLLLQDFPKGGRAKNPLVHDGFGKPLKKQQFVTRLQHLAAASGHQDLVIRGHSMRVTGAMRMALAGLPNEVIKVFGRWASEAVMAHLRESIVQGKGAW